ncbi:hypothetical protein TNIN_476271 [Trichonephila inaurata madagascariensis]|uniref:Uncharacterized protein n=1 Tax=Trichonephila inaurata madagascariensis TaxID=2747483 RepID=A0A8X6WQ61_9ARAC|nr:hypothetical protein TNIN_476271 [Trichonephila inaurata madagascariensis]
MFTLSRTHRKALAVEQLFKTCLPGRCSKTNRDHLRIVKRFLLPDNCVLYRLEEHKYSSDSLNLRCTVAPKLREQCPVAGVGIEISRYALACKTVLTPSDQPFQ